MILERQHEGKAIEFTSLKCGDVQAKLISFNKDHIQVKLLKSLSSKNRTWFVGDVRLFDMDKVSNIEIIELPEKKRDAEFKPTESKKRRIQYTKNVVNRNDKRTEIV